MARLRLLVQPSPLPDLGTLQRQVIDVMALTGDTADNVPGVPGIGPKTAAKLISRWGSLDAVILSAITGYADGTMTARIAGLVARNVHQALMSRELVRLNEHVPVAPL